MTLRVAPPALIRIRVASLLAAWAEDRAAPPTSPMTAPARPASPQARIGSTPARSPRQASVLRTMQAVLADMQRLMAILQCRHEEETPEFKQLHALYRQLSSTVKGQAGRLSLPGMRES